MNSFGDQDLTYNANGELTEKRDRTTGASTHLTYSPLGALTGATTADGRQISYLSDAAGNRVAKQVDGQLTDGYLYAPGMLGPVAQQNATGATTARFIYATHANVPDYIVKGSSTYRVITDQLGSVRMVVDATSGAVAQEIEYGPFGEITSDSNPGFQPFGFAGGLYDSDTGLTHFGAREYDAGLGRWTSKDPIGFGGGDSNLYGYVLGDPVNWVDPWGFGAMDAQLRPAPGPQLKPVSPDTDDGNTVNDVSNAIAGFGDKASWGASRWARERINGGYDPVDKCSSAYKYGGYAGTAVSTVAGAGGTRAAVAAANDARKMRPIVQLYAPSRQSEFAQEAARGVVNGARQDIPRVVAEYAVGDMADTVMNGSSGCCC